MWPINLLTCDIIEKCLVLTFMRIVLSVGEIQLGSKDVYWSLFTLDNTLLTAKTFFKIILYLNFN